MVSLDTQVVATALPVIRVQLHASLAELEWTVNAYTLTFAVLLLTGAALGERLGRRRMLATGGRRVSPRPRPGARWHRTPQPWSRPGPCRAPGRR